MAACGLLRVFLVFSALQVSSGTVRFYFHLLSYSVGSRCEDPLGTKCDPMFTFCFDTPKSSFSIDTCFYKKTRDSGYFSDASSLTFGDDIKGIANPIIFDMNITEEFKVMLVARVMDYDSFNGNDHLATIGHNITFSVAPNITVAQYVRGSASKDGETLLYEYKAFCADNYYGANCTRRCVPKESSVEGYLTCDEAGQLHCSSGWTGDDCTTDVNECEETPNICDTNSGSTPFNPIRCINTEGSYRCGCTEGWKGDNCDEDVNECEEVASPACDNGGTCANTNGSFGCTCPANWQGPTCSDDVDECQTMTSSCFTSHSQCNNTFGGYTCICNVGWMGDNCDMDVDECQASTAPCSNGGNCTNIEGDFTCECEAGWTGETCATDVDECEGDVCLPDASCENFMGHFQCTCANGSLGCYNPEGHTGGAINASASRQTKKEEFIWWPFVLVAVILFLAIILVACFVLSKRRRKKKPRSRPPSSAEVQTFHPGGFMFENSLYNYNKDRPPSTSSNPDTRSPLPLPTPTDVVADDKFIYHDLDEDLGVKTFSPENPYASPSYANRQVALDTRAQAGNHYEDFDELKRKSEEDVSGYMIPRSPTQVKSSPEDKASKDNVPAVPPKRRGDQPSHGYANMAFEADEEERQPEPLKNSTTPYESSQTLATPDLRDDNVFTWGDHDDTRNTGRAEEEERAPALEEDQDDGFLEEPDEANKDNHSDDGDDKQLEFVGSFRKDWAGEGRLNMDSQGETATEDMDDVGASADHLWQYPLNEMARKNQPK